jgi:hypothetical protein
MPLAKLSGARFTAPIQTWLLSDGAHDQATYLNRRKRKETRHHGYSLSIADMAGPTTLPTNSKQSSCLSSQFELKARSYCCWRSDQAVIHRNKESTLETFLLGLGHGNDRVHLELSSLLAAQTGRLLLLVGFSRTRGAPQFRSDRTMCLCRFPCAIACLDFNHIGF